MSSKPTGTASEPAASRSRAQFVVLDPAKVLETSETILPGVLDVRVRKGVLEKLVNVRRVMRTADQKLEEDGQEWRPVDVVE